jgi:hypothetical protein
LTVVITAMTVFGGLSFGPFHNALTLVSLALVAWLTFVLWRRSRLDDRGEDHRS